MALKIYNSLGRRLETFTPRVPGKVGMYVCGMTIYDLCHVGHTRMMMAFDVVVRWLRASGYDVTYVRNITDIDDKIIKRAVERSITIRELTDEMIQAMREDIRALGILAPTHEPRATEYVGEMLDMIGLLERRGYAYRAASGDVNFAVRKFNGYGKLSGKSLDELRAGERVAVADDKHDPLDFVMWKASKPDEPAEAKYSGPYGQGRPGWHIECSAMSRALLGDAFDIHGGGADLQFPHHENEIAQSEGALGHPFVGAWLHNGFVNVDNEKMSKSLGNFFTIREVLAHFDGETLRFFLLRTHYRSPLNFSNVLLEDARNALRRLYTALDAFPSLATQAGEADMSGVEIAPIDWSDPDAVRFKEAMDDDFNVPAALAVMFELASRANRDRDDSAARLLMGLGATLGLLQQPPRVFLQGSDPQENARIEEAISRRAAAKSQRDFALADQIRKELLERGIELKDSPLGTTWVKR